MANLSRSQLYQMYAGEVEDAYRKAKAEGMEHPVISLRINNLIIDDAHVRGIIENAERAGQQTFTAAIRVETHQEAYRSLAKESFQTALALGRAPNPGTPFVVILITAEGASVAKMSAPG